MDLIHIATAGPSQASPGPLVPEARLVSAAHQFEALMMKELLEPMGREFVEDSDAQGQGVLGDFACENLAGALSAGGGLGIADRVLQTVHGTRISPGSSGGRSTEISTAK